MLSELIHARGVNAVAVEIGDPFDRVRISLANSRKIDLTTGASTLPIADSGP